MHCKRFIFTMLSLLMLFSLQSFAKDVVYSDGVLLVRFSDDVILQNLDNKLKVSDPVLESLFEEYNALDFDGFFGDYIIQNEEISYLTRNDYKIFFPKTSDMEYIAEKVNDAVGIEWACPDYHLKNDYVPTDPSINSQWFHDKIQSFDAWDHCTGTSDILVVGIDSGVDWDHPDLIGNIWVNPGEDIDGDPSPNNTMFPGEPGTIGDWNSIDDDGNGFIDDFIGWDFVANVSSYEPGEDFETPDNNPMDFNGHGTGVAGAMAEVGNNNIGGAGVAFDCQILPVRCGYSDPQGRGMTILSYAVSAIYYAMDIADTYDKTLVFNMSFGGNTQNQPMRDATINAWNDGHLLFGSAGNDGVDEVHYPSAYQNVISVAATNSQDQRASFSNWGQWVDIAAPGENCYTPWFDDSYDSWQGTSVSTPIAAGLGAMIIQRYPNFTNDIWREIIETTTDEIETDHYVGSGRINAYKALTQYFWPELSIDSITLSDPDGNGHPDAGEVIDVVVEITNEEGWLDASSVSVILSFDNTSIELTNEEIVLGNIASGTSTNNSSTPLQFSVPQSWGDGDFVNMTVTAYCSPNDYTVSEQQRILVGIPEILFVDDDNGSHWDSFLIADMEDLNLVYHTVNNSVASAIPMDDLQDYAVVIWHTSGAENPISEADITALTAMTEAGLGVFITGETIDDQLAGTDFYANVLHAEHADGSTQLVVNALAGAGGPFEDGMQFVLAGAGGSGTTSDPDVIVPVNGAIAALEYMNLPDNCGGIYYDGTDYKLVYLPFNFDAVSGANGTTSRTYFLNNLLTFYGTAVDENLETSLPDKFAVKPAYPNPFNPEVSVPVELAYKANINLKVYDILGRQVANIDKGIISAGRHLLKWNGAGNASGIYFLSVNINNQSYTQKVTLLK